MKNTALFIAGVVGFLWLIAAMSIGSNFEELVIGWAVIGGIYLLFKMFD